MPVPVVDPVRVLVPAAFSPMMLPSTTLFVAVPNGDEIITSVPELPEITLPAWEPGTLVVPPIVSPVPPGRYTPYWLFATAESSR